MAVCGRRRLTGLRAMMETATGQARAMLITGASAGIGAALAFEFARRGYALALAARRLDRLEGLLPRLRAAGSPQAIALALDVSDADRIEDVVRQAAQALGRLDVVVAN